MTIPKDDYTKLLDDIKVGNSVAEEDFLLESARVETETFNGVLNDKYDIVPGRKGAGKTAIFKLINFSSGILLGRRNLVILSGVNSAGEPIFNTFKTHFEEFSEARFENFWKLYFITLIYNEFIKDPKFDAKLTDCKEEIDAFKDECHKAGIPEIPARQTGPQLLSWVINALSKVKIKVPISYDTKTQILLAFPEVELSKNSDSQIDAQTQNEQDSIYVNNIGLALKKILEKSGFKIWIILDRLDEVFDRYSIVEFNGLRGLLRAHRSFDIGENSDIFRIKIFLRDDIKDFLTDGESYKKYFKGKTIPPLVAATHIFSKEAPTLSWSEDEIEQLILNRLLFSSKRLRNYLNISQKYEGLREEEMFSKLKDELRNKRNRLDYWNKIFPIKISSYASIKWIFTHLKDSNDVVTPRTVIDTLEAALNYQKNKMQSDFADSPVIFPVESLKSGIDIASKYKLEKDIYNEFPKEQSYIKSLSKIGKAKLTKKDLESLYGTKWEEIVLMLRRIGILKYVKNSDEYRIEYIFRPSLDINYRY